MIRSVGGVPLLHFEEGRPRYVDAFGQHVTSHGQHRRLKRIYGVGESGDYVPESIRKDPKSNKMKEFLAKDSKRRWL